MRNRPKVGARPSQADELYPGRVKYCNKTGKRIDLRQAAWVTPWRQADTLTLLNVHRESTLQSGFDVAHSHFLTR